MKLLDFDRYYPNEDACKQAFKEIRIKNGVVCPHCGGINHYWKSDKEMFQCKACGYRQSLKANTVLHGSKLPFRTWFIAMHLLTATKHTFSALEMQRQLGSKRYQPVWEMMHKLRTAMGKRDSEYFLTYAVELDEAFFTTATPKALNGKKLKQGSGSERKAKVIVMAESTPVYDRQPNKKAKKVGHIKMLVIPDMKKSTLTDMAVRHIHPKAHVTMDASMAHRDIESKFDSHVEKLLTQDEIDKVLPWVHTTIANAKMLLADTYHGITTDLLQDYLNEFCYKFNRRYFGENIFDRLLTVCGKYKNDFYHRIYSHGRMYATCA